MELVPLALAAPLLVWIAWTDFRDMRIRNAAVLVAIGLFVGTVPFIGTDEALFRLVAGVAVFFGGFAMFAARLVGGGDVKMGSALILFVPSGTYTLFAFVFAAATMLAILAVVALRAVPVLRRSGAVSMRAHGTVPMGIALCLSGVAHLGILSALG